MGRTNIWTTSTANGLRRLIGQVQRDIPKYNNDPMHGLMANYFHDYLTNQYQILYPRIQQMTPTGQLGREPPTHTHPPLNIPQQPQMVYDPISGSMVNYQNPTLTNVGRPRPAPKRTPPPAHVGVNPPIGSGILRTDWRRKCGGKPTEATLDEIMRANLAKIHELVGLKIHLTVTQPPGWEQEHRRVENLISALRDDVDYYYSLNLND
jgi:hypothetical protein